MALKVPLAKVTLDIKDELKAVFDNATARKVGEASITGIKELTAVGKSPVSGEKRFPGYAAQREPGSKKKKYPKSIWSSNPSKLLRPINLRLSGDMLDALEHRLDARGTSVVIEITDALELKKAETHNDGTQTDRNIPQRKFMPNQAGEEFAPSIMTKVVDIIRERVLDLIRNSNNKR